MVPSDTALLEIVRGSGAHAVSVTRHGTEVEVGLADGRRLTLVFTDLEHNGAPELLRHPWRELETWRALLAPARIGPRLYGAGEGWLLIERAPGVALAQLTTPASWAAAVRWLGAVHAQFGERADRLRDANPYLLDLSQDWFAVWWGRALAALADSPDPRARRLRRALQRYERVERALAALPRTLVHGQLLASNVLVGAGERHVWARDWSMAAIGPGLIDLATLTAGCADAERARLLSTYRRAARTSVTAADLDRCRLHLALQAIALAAADSVLATPDAHDRIGEALDLAERLEL